MKAMAYTVACTLVAVATASTVSTVSTLRTTTVGLRQSESGKAELERLFWEVATPGSPNYQQYITR